jgi:hypothetical protein
MTPFMANAISLDSLNSAIQDKKEELTQAQFDEYLSTLEGNQAISSNASICVGEVGSCNTPCTG